MAGSVPPAASASLPAVAAGDGGVVVFIFGVGSRQTGRPALRRVARRRDGSAHGQGRGARHSGRRRPQADSIGGGVRRQNRSRRDDSAPQDFGGGSQYLPLPVVAPVGRESPFT